MKKKTVQRSQHTKKSVVSSLRLSASGGRSVKRRSNLGNIHKHTYAWVNKALSFFGVMILLFGFGVFCWIVKEMARVGVLGISTVK